MRVCRSCGVEFLGLTRRVDCDACQAARIKREKRETERRRLRRRKPPIAVRVKHCERCDTPFFIASRSSSRQRYCSKSCWPSGPNLTPETRARNKQRDQAAYHANKDAMQREHRAYNQRQADQLSDQYIRKLVAKHSPLLKSADIPQSFVELKRAELLLKRELRKENP